MKRVCFLIIIALIFGVSVKAQRPDISEFDFNEMVIKIVSDLNIEAKLQPAIQDSIKVILIEFFREMKNSFESGNPPDYEKASSQRDIKVKKLLNDDQYKVYLKFMGNKAGNRPSPLRNGVR